MLEIVVPKKEYYINATNQFIYVNECKLQLEHSLISISKWESKWNRPFLSKGPSNSKETKDYVRCMTINSNVDPMVYEGLTNLHIDQINEYINKSMTATWFSDDKSKGNGKPMSREVITSELIYYWMITLNIPMECQKWHINRLLTLIRVCQVKNAPPKKMSKEELYSRHRKLNAMRRAKARR